jgi:hypothetical protein
MIKINDKDKDLLIEVIKKIKVFKSILSVTTVIVFCNTFTFSQSKKEQILIKQLTIDSLLAINKDLNQKIIKNNIYTDSIELMSKRLSSQIELINKNKQTKIDSLSKLITVIKNDNHKIKNIVEINYGKIEGYNIKVLWSPIDFRTFDLQTNTGPAIILMENIQNEIKYFTVKHFSPIKKVYSQNEDEYDVLNEAQIQNFYTINFTRDSNFRIIKINNNQIDLSNLSRNELPFYFIDIDYNFEKEIVFIDQGSGQRGGNRSLIFQINNEKIFPLGNDVYENNIGIESMIDDLSTINTKNQTIKIVSSGGICATTIETYKFYNNMYKLIQSIVPIEIYNNVTRENECIEQVFSHDLESGKKILISKKKIN